MALYQATQCKYPGPIQALLNADGANDVVAIVGDFTLPAGLVSGDIVEMVGIPAGYVPVDVIAASEGLGTTMTADVGILSGNYGALLGLDGSSARTCGAEFMTGKAFQTAGIYRMDVYGGAQIAPTLGDMSTTPVPTTGDRGVGVKFTTVSAPTTGKKMRVTLLARPRIEGV